MSALPRYCRPSLLGIVGASLLVSCGPSQNATQSVCNQRQRTELLNVTLDPWAPSMPFGVDQDKVAWIQVTHPPSSSETLFGSLGGIAEVHSLKSGAAPRVETSANGDKTSKDPAIIIQKPLTWQLLQLGPGIWQLYSLSNPGIEVVSCPLS